MKARRCDGLYNNTEFLGIGIRPRQTKFVERVELNESPGFQVVCTVV